MEFVQKNINFGVEGRPLDLVGLHLLIKIDSVAGVCFPNALRILSTMNEPIIQ